MINRYNCIFLTWYVPIINVILISRPTKLNASEHGQVLYGRIHRSYWPLHSLLVSCWNCDSWRSAPGWCNADTELQMWLSSSVWVSPFVLDPTAVFKYVGSWRNTIWSDVLLLVVSLKVCTIDVISNVIFLNNVFRKSTTAVLALLGVASDRK
jgi:hypothetical protein